MRRFKNKTDALKFVSEWMGRDGFKHLRLQIQIEYNAATKKYEVQIEQY